MKNQIKKYSKMIGLLTFFFLLLGCDDFVTVDAPKSQLTSSAVFEDTSTATATLTNIYAQMRENGILTGRIGGFSCLLGVYSDELISYESGIYSTESFYANSLLSSNSYISSLWNNTYSQIYAANAVIEGVTNSSTLNETVKKQLKGEALFIRAFLHFQLMNVFGDIPYVKTTDYNQNSSVGRMNVEQVYQDIISDLENATTLVDASYLNYDRIRPNKAVIQALLARVYLYHGDYAEASNSASAVLNETATYQLEENLDEEFLSESTSTIWQFSPGASGANAYEANTFIFFVGPPNRVALNPSLISQFETLDLRKNHWVKEVTNGSEIWYHTYKYKQDNATSTSLEYSIVLRLPEQYLIRAEARAKQGDLIGAKEDLNIIRQRAGLAGTLAETQNEILESIFQERRVELFTEFGHRFFDLKRAGQLDAVLAYKPGWSITDQLWPIPLIEMEANPFLTPQNPGY